MKLLKPSLIVVLFFCAATAFAVNKKAFEETLKKAEDATKNYTTDSYYDKFEFTNKKTGQKRNFGDFDEAEKRVLKVLQGQIISNMMLELSEKWDEELKAAEEAPNTADEASKKDVENYIAELLKIRKNHAAQYEREVDKLFADYPNKFSKEEMDFFIKSVKEFNDKHKLITR